MTDGTVVDMERHPPVCSPCLAQLSSPHEQLLALQAAVLEESEPLVTVTHLLRLCRDEHRGLWEGRQEPGHRRSVTSAIGAVEDLISREGPSDLLQAPVRRGLSQALGLLPGVPHVMVARGLAELLDERFGHTFADSFRRRSPYQPGVGDPVPLDSPDLRRVTPMRPTSPPWRLANRLDETRRVRLAGEWAVQFRAVFDYSISDQLDTLMTHDTVIATCHPNRNLQELDLSHLSDGRTFPIGPVDATRQRRDVNQLVGQATAAGASIIVLPELCLTEEIALDLGEWVRRSDGPNLLVAGSFHHDDPHDKEPGQARRRNTTMVWVRGHDQPLLHDKHSPGDRPILEDIEPDGWPELRVYVSSGGWHLVFAICRDLLNPLAVNALAESGANLVLVPAMSETLMAFGGPVAHLVGAGQAFVAVANNPADWTPEEDGSVPRHPSRALFGHPGLGQQARFVNSADAEPGLALMRTDSAHIMWVPGAASRLAPTARVARARLDVHPTPSWITRLLPTTAPAASVQYRAAQVTLRQSAVLVLISGGAHGPQVLLTERAHDLTDYPGQVVFPGGVAEPSDDGPVTTALREAREEVGLDLNRVHVIGCFPPLALPDTGFIVHPVLAWTEKATFLGSANHAEVAVRLEVPLCELADPHREEPWQLGTVTSGVLDLLVAGFQSANAGSGIGESTDGRGTPAPARRTLGRTSR